METFLQRISLRSRVLRCAGMGVGTEALPRGVSGHCAPSRPYPKANRVLSSGFPRLKRWDFLGSLGTVSLKGNQSWIFVGRTDAEAETPILWAPDAKNWHLKRPWCWERLRQEEKGTTEDEMTGWHHWLSGHGFGWTPGVGDRCYHSWGCKELKTTERLNWTEVFGPLDFIFLKYDYLNRVIIIRQVNVDKIIEMKSCGLLVLPFTC